MTTYKSTTQLLDSPFDSPLYTGSALSTDSPYTFPVAINGRQYRIDLAQYQRSTLATLRPPQDNSNEPGEQSLNTESTWRRSQGDWILGAGQSYLDDLQDPPSNRTQFYTSRGVNPWVRRQLSLLHDTRRILTSSDTNLKLLSVPGYLYVTDGQQLKFSANPGNASPTWTSSAIHGIASPVAVTDLTTVGAKIYAACGANGINWTAYGASSSTNFSAYAAKLVEFAGGFLIGASAGDISSIDDAGVASSIFTHFDSAMDWTDIEGTPHGIYVCGNTQGVAETWYIGIDSTTGGLLPPSFAGGLPNGETINSMTWYQGFMLFGTSAGMRQATVNRFTNGLEYGPLVVVPGGVTAMDPQHEFVWFSWTNYDSSHTGTGRVDLARNTEPSLPAYATDVMAATQGVVAGVATFGGQTYFGVASSGVWAEFSDYVSSGVIDSGWIRYGTVERKVAVSADVHHQSLPVGASVAVSLIKDDDTTVNCGISNTAASLGPPDPYGAAQASGEAFRLVLTLGRATDATVSPVLRRWTLRATPTPIRTDEIIVPLIVANTVSSGEEVGRDWSYDPLVEFQYLKGLEASRQVVTYQEGAAAYPVQVDQVVLKPGKWADDNRGFDGTIIVRLLTVGTNA